MGALKELWFSLHGRIRICLVIFFFGIALAAMYAFVSSWMSVQSALRRYFDAAEAEIRLNMESYFQSLENAARRAGYSITVQQYLLAENPETVIFSFPAAAAHITDSLGLTGNCLNIYLEAENRRYLRSNLSYLDEIRRLLKEKVPRGSAVSRPFFAGVSDIQDRSAGLLLYVFPVYSVLSNRPQNIITGVLVCGMEAAAKAPFSADFDGDAGSFLLYKDRVIFSSPGFEYMPETLLADVKPGQYRVSINGGYYLTIKVSMPERSWDYIYLIPEASVFTRVFAMMNKSIPILSAAVLLMILFVILIVSSVNSGIMRMVEDLNSLEYGRQPGLGKPRLKELELISRSVDFMLGRINRAVQREQEANEKLLGAVTAQAQAEFMSYRAQINPHFLFNTLECMRAMAHSSRDAQLEIMISSMSRMFRYSLYAKPMVSLSLELEHLQNYMNVMNIRSGGRYTLRLNIDGEAGSRMVPSMILQPLAENAVTHGFAKIERINAVIMAQAICAEGPQGPVLLRFADNGVGIEEAALKTLRENSEAQNGAAHALCNIRRRMRLSFGGSFSFSIKSKPGYYTVIEMRIPAEAELAIPEIK